MDNWVPKGALPQGAANDGAFERFLTAAIAAIITIMFSWRLLDDMQDAEQTEDTDDSTGRLNLAQPSGAHTLAATQVFVSQLAELHSGDTETASRTGKLSTEPDEPWVPETPGQDSACDAISPPVPEQHFNSTLCVDSDYFHPFVSGAGGGSIDGAYTDAPFQNEEPRELGEDEDLFCCSLLEPILEEDSEDIINSSDDFEHQQNVADYNIDVSEAGTISSTSSRECETDDSTACNLSVQEPDAFDVENTQQPVNTVPVRQSQADTTEKRTVEALHIDYSPPRVDNLYDSTTDHKQAQSRHLTDNEVDVCHSQVFPVPMEKVENSLTCTIPTSPEVQFPGMQSDSNDQGPVLEQFGGHSDVFCDAALSVVTEETPFGFFAGMQPAEYEELVKRYTQETSDSASKTLLSTVLLKLYADAHLSDGVEKKPVGYTFVAFGTKVTTRQEQRTFLVHRTLAPDFETFIAGCPFTSETVDKEAETSAIEDFGYYAFVKELNRSSDVESKLSAAAADEDACILSGNLAPTETDRVFTFQEAIPAVSSVTRNLHDAFDSDHGNSNSCSKTEESSEGPLDASFDVDASQPAEQKVAYLLAGNTVICPTEVEAEDKANSSVDFVQRMKLKSEPACSVPLELDTNPSERNSSGSTCVTEKIPLSYTAGPCLVPAYDEENVCVKEVSSVLQKEREPSTELSVGQEEDSFIDQEKDAFLDQEQEPHTDLKREPSADLGASVSKNSSATVSEDSLLPAVGLSGNEISAHDEDAAYPSGEAITSSRDQVSTGIWGPEVERVPPPQPKPRRSISSMDSAENISVPEPQPLPRKRLWYSQSDVQEADEDSTEDWKQPYLQSGHDSPEDENYPQVPSARPRSFKEIKRRTQQRTGTHPAVAPFVVPEHMLTPTRIRTLASKKHFLSADSVGGDSLREQFAHYKSSPRPAKEWRYKTRSKSPGMSPTLSSQAQFERLKNLVNWTRHSQPSLHRPAIDHLHEGCILTPEGRRDILNKTFSIETLNRSLPDYLHEHGSFTSLVGGETLQTGHFTETDVDAFGLMFQSHQPLQRSASMSDLLVGPLGSTQPHAGRKTGKDRFMMHRFYKKSKSLCTLETNIDDVTETVDEDGLKRVPSVHELRVTKSLQKLNVPDWFKKSSLSKSSSCLLKYGSSSTMNSFSFSPSLVSSPCASTAPPATNVVIKTRVVPPSSSRSLRPGPLVGSGSSSGRNAPAPPVKLPSEKFREKEKHKSLMPIPIVPFAQIRAMFENKGKSEHHIDSKGSEKTKVQSSASDVSEGGRDSSHTVAVKPDRIVTIREESIDEEDVKEEQPATVSQVHQTNPVPEWQRRPADTSHQAESRISQPPVTNHADVTFPASVSTATGILTGSQETNKRHVGQSQQGSSPDGKQDTKPQSSSRSLRSVFGLSKEKRTETRQKKPVDSFLSEDAVYESEPRRRDVGALARSFDKKSVSQSASGSSSSKGELYTESRVVVPTTIRKPVEISEHEETNTSPLKTQSTSRFEERLGKPFATVPSASLSGNGACYKSHDAVLKTQVKPAGTQSVKETTV